MLILEYVVNGICQGSIYALIAIGYTLIFGVTGLVTFCYGELVMLGGFGSYFVFTMVGVNVPLALVGSFLFAAAIGFFVHKTCYEPFLNAPRYISLLCTIAMSTLLRNLTQILITSESRALPTILKGLKFKIANVTVTYLQLVIIGTVIVLCIILSLFLNKTRIGVAIRCVKQDRMAADLVGVDASRITLFGNCLGSGLAGIAGLLYTIYYTTVNANLGTAIGRIGFSSAILGGMVSIPWAAFGGVIIGVLENISTIWISPNLKSGVAYVFLIIVLVFLPQGIKSKNRRRT